VTELQAILLSVTVNNWIDKPSCSDGALLLEFRHFYLDKEQLAVPECEQHRSDRCQKGA
jgi:hypothetical protein